MKRQNLFLLEKSTIQTFAVFLILVATVILNSYVDKHVLHTKDFYSPLIYFAIILWVQYSILYCVTLDHNTNEKVIHKRKFDQSTDLTGKLLKLIALVLLGYRTFFIWGPYGVLVSLFIITISGSLSFYAIARKTFGKKSVPTNFMEILGQFAVYVGIVGYIYFIPWRASFRYEFGIKEIGNYFEKSTYETKYIIKISRTSNWVTYSLPADLVVSDDFSEFEDDDAGAGAFSEESSQTVEVRQAKIKRVYFKDGGFLYFDDCLIPIKSSGTCTDQNGEEWEIEITKEKAK